MRNYIRAIRNRLRGGLKVNPIRRMIAREVRRALREQPGLTHLHSPHGVLVSTARMSAAEKFDANQYYQYSNKALAALAATSMWRGGDYMEFGSTDLNTFRNMLTAFDIFNLFATYPDTRFYAFDIFGKVKADDEAIERRIDAGEGYREYMSIFGARGDVLAENYAILKSHNLFVEKCELIQGYFEKTLSPERKAEYLAQGRQVGFACLDCNIGPPYKLVFEFLVDLMARYSYIYMDEYYSDHVIRYFDQFVAELRARRNMDARFMRNAGGFGAMFFLYPTDAEMPSLEFPPPLPQPAE
jgi:hypothetical protein